jgi:hypothetical protein
MRKCGKGTLLLMSAVMATSLFTGCGKGKSSQTQKNEVYATIKKSDQSASAAQICAWLSYRAKNNRLFQNEGIELSYCSDNLAVFSDSVGSVIYDRTKKKVIAAVDLDKIGCDHFYSEGDEENPGLETAIKVSKDQKWMIIYNQLQGKVNGNIYAYSLKQCDNMKLAKITPSKQISEKDKLYQTIIKDHKHTQKKSDSIPGKIGDKIRAMDVSSSKYAYQWKDSKGIRKQSVLVVDKDGLKLYTLSRKENQPDIQSEMVDLKTSGKIKLNTKLPEYEYTGKDLRIKAVFDETKKRSDEDKEEGLVTIPMLNIYKIVETKSGAKVYANFWSETYYRYGSLLKNYSGGSCPGVMYLKKTKDGYRVTKTRYAEDGESLERSIWKLCKGYPDVAIRMMKDSVTQNQRKKVLQKYVSQNKLKIKAYKEYGWQYVNL